MSTRSTTPACGPSTIRPNDPVYIDPADVHGIVKRVDREAGVAIVNVATGGTSKRSRREVPLSSLTLSRDAPKRPTDRDIANLKAELYS